MLILMELIPDCIFFVTIKHRGSGDNYSICLDTFPFIKTYISLNGLYSAVLW